MKMRNVLLKGAMTLAVIISPVAMAQSNQSAGSGPNPFTDCGIGAALFSETKWAAVTSNVIWDIGITAIISATASPQTCSGKKASALAFVGKTHDVLTEELARGKGEHVATAFNILECKAENHASAIFAARADVAALVNTPDFAMQPRMEKAGRIYTAIEKAAANHCAS